MKKLILVALVLSILPFHWSCGFKETVVQPDSKSYIWFNGNTEKTTAIIDNNTEFKIEQNYYLNDRGEKVKKSGKALYEVEPGKHEVMVKRNNEVIVHRILMISAGAIKEVNVP